MQSINQVYKLDQYILCKVTRVSRQRGNEAKRGKASETDVKITAIK